MPGKYFIGFFKKVRKSVDSIVTTNRLDIKIKLIH